MNMFTLLKQDHKKVKDALEKILEKDEISLSDLEPICQELLIHMEMEEKHLYPVMGKYQEAAEIVEEAVLEHQEAKKVLQEIQGGKIKATKLKVKTEILQLEIEHHVEEEENELFEQIEKLLSKNEIDELGKKMQAFKESRTEKQTVKK